MSPWLVWSAIAIAVLVAGIVLAVVTTPDGGPEATGLRDMSLAAQEDLFRQIDAATVPDDLAWLDLDAQRILFRTLESSGVLTGMSLDAQRVLFHTIDATTMPGVLEGMSLDAQWTLFRMLEAGVTD